MKTTALFILFAATSALCAVHESRDFDSTGLKEVVLRNSAGNVQLRGSLGNKTVVSMDKEEFSKDCDLSMERNGPTLFVESRSKHAFGGACTVHFNLEVPSDVSVNVQTGKGDLQVNGTQGKLSFELGMGDAQVQGDVSALRGKVGNGDIVVRSLKGGADLKTGMGSVRVFYDQVPTEGGLNVATGKGDAVIYMPQQARVAAKMKSGYGMTLNELAQTSQGFPVELKAGTGNLSIKKRN